MSTSRVLLLLVSGIIVVSPVVFAEGSTSIVTNKNGSCTVEQKADLILLGMSIDEVNARCGASSNNNSQVIVNINNNNINTQNSNNADNFGNYQQPIFVNAHEPENFLVKLGMGMHSTSFKNDECSDCEVVLPIGYDLFSFRFYSNSIQPGSVGLHLNWAQLLPLLSYEYSDFQGSYSVAILNMPRTAGVEYIGGGSTGGSFIPGFAVVFGSVEQTIQVSECDGHCDAADSLEGTNSGPLSGVSVSLYSRDISSIGSGSSFSLSYLSTGDADDIIDFSVIGLEFSAIW